MNFLLKPFYSLFMNKKLSDHKKADVTTQHNCFGFLRETLFYSEPGCIRETKVNIYVCARRSLRQTKGVLARASGAESRGWRMSSPSLYLSCGIRKFSRRQEFTASLSPSRSEMAWPLLKTTSAAKCKWSRYSPPSGRAHALALLTFTWKVQGRAFLPNPE